MRPMNCSYDLLTVMIIYRFPKTCVWYQKTWDSCERKSMIWEVISSMQAVEYPPHQKDFDVDLLDALIDMQGF